MAKAIVRLADSSDLRAQMGAAGRKRIENHFSWACKGVFMSDLLAELDVQQSSRCGS
jgi:glycosyltransferase involved in cell wall biosynthesis